jgi:TPR repeat protein
LAAVPTKAGAQMPAAPRLPDRQLAELLARGDVFLRAGDIASARLFYERAAEAGDGQAALRMGATFDPSFLASAGLHNLRGDPAKARLWYHRALGLGASEAQPHLNNLETK